MNNTEDILKRILLNMRYDSRDTLSENKGKITKIISEQAQGPTSNTKGIFDKGADPTYLAQQKEYEKNIKKPASNMVI